MRLHWFREHKQIVYWIICPLIVVSMSIFGLSSCNDKGSRTAASGLYISYVVGNKSVYLSPSEVLEQRQTLYSMYNRYYPGNKAVAENATTNNIGMMSAEVEAARQLGFEVGVEERKELLRKKVIERIQQIDRIKDPSEITLKKADYAKLLKHMQMTESQFETLVQNLALRDKLEAALVESVNVSESQLFINYCVGKENVRFRYLTFKSSDPKYDAQVKEPTADEIKKYFDGNLGNMNNSPYKDIYMAPPALSLDALFYKDDKAFANLTPTDKDLQTTYNNLKPVIWKDTPFEKVPKAEIEKHWRTTKMSELMRVAEANVAKSVADLKAAEDKFMADPVNKGKIFDLVGWAKTNHMTYWTTPEQTEEKYAAGKLEVNAPDLVVGKTIFGFTHLPPNAPPPMAEGMRKHMVDFTPIQWINNEKPELGGIVARKRTFTDSQIRTLEQATPLIAAQLKMVQRIDLAQKDAEAKREKWRRGEELPASLDAFDEVTSDEKDKHGLVQVFRKSPKPVGEVLDVANNKDDIAKSQSDVANKSAKPGDPVLEQKDTEFYVGCAVERKLPSMSAFAKDSEWSRDEVLHGRRSYRFDNGQIVPVYIPGIVGKDAESVLGLMLEQIKSYITSPDGQMEPPLGNTVQNSDN